MDPQWRRVEPMLATLGSPPADRRRWAVEYKWDGIRALLLADDGRLDLVSRSGQIITGSFPDVATVLADRIGGREAVLDGEIVSLFRGSPSFEALQQRVNVAHPSEHRQRRFPASIMLFDVLMLDDHDLTGLPYRERRDVLAGLGLAHPPVVQVPPHYEDLAVEQLLAIAGEHGLEGVVVKRLDSRYRSGRSRSWIKIPLRRTLEVLVGGWQLGRGQLADTVGALLLGGWAPDGRLIYLGHVSAGLTRAHRRALAHGLPPLEVADCPFDPPPPDEHARTARWVRPELVVQVDYKELTTGGRLRAPSWKRVRVDADPASVMAPRPGDQNSIGSPHT